MGAPTQSWVSPNVSLGIFLAYGNTSWRTVAHAHAYLTSQFSHFRHILTLVDSKSAYVWTWKLYTRKEGMLAELRTTAAPSSAATATITPTTTSTGKRWGLSSCFQQCTMVLQFRRLLGQSFIPVNSNKWANQRPSSSIPCTLVVSTFLINKWATAWTCIHYWSDGKRCFCAICWKCASPMQKWYGNI